MGSLGSDRGKAKRCHLTVSLKQEMATETAVLVPTVTTSPNPNTD